MPVTYKMSRPTKDYKILTDWFTKKDSLGHIISSWCKKINDDEVQCIVCKKSICCTKKGFAALSQHVSTSIHKSQANLILSSQLLLKPHSVNSASKEQNSQNLTDNHNASNSSTEIKLHNSKEAATKAEIIWTLKSVQCNMASGVADDLKQVFSVMFPSAVPDNFHLGRTKLSYLITDALGPYFREEFLLDLRKSPYALLFDETINNADKKELQLMARYWSEQENQVVCKYLKTIFLGHATGNVVSEEMNNALNNLGVSKKNMIMLGSDGPNVNKTIWRIFNDELIEERGHGLLNIGTCNLHTVHNAFLRGLEEFGDTAIDLIVDVYNFFKKYPARWEDFQNAQNKTNTPKHRFLKHVSSRWLTLGPASQRLLEQWPALEEYFLIYIPAKEKRIMQTEKYKRIIKYIKYVDIEVELCFIQESSELFASFLELFQRSEPLIHLLYSHLKELLYKMSGRICKQNSNSAVIPKEIEIEHLREAAKTDCGEATSNFLEKLEEKDRLNALYKIQRHYMAAHNYLIRKCMLQKIMHFKCLQINEISKASSIGFISKIAKSLSFLEINELNVKDEWRLLQSQFTAPVECHLRIDHFWRQILSERTALGNLRYPSVAKVIKACLCLSHGNSDVERGFSVSRRVLTDEKSSMSERCLDARLVIKDSLRKYETVSQVPITKKMLSLAYSAHRSYEFYLEEQKRIKESEIRAKKEEEEKLKQETLRKEKVTQQKEKIEELETKAKLEAQEKKEAQKSSDGLFKEAHERLKTAIEKNDFVQIKIAQGMLEGVEKLRQKERQHDEKEAKLIKIVNKRKSNMIDSFFKTDSTKQKKL